MTVRQLENGTHEVQNQYPRVVKREGNRVAQELVNKVFEVCDRKWRGVGSIPKSGYKLRDEFREHDAERLFDVKGIDTRGTGDLHQRPGLAGREKTARLPRLRQALHAGASARRDDGFRRGRMRRLLRIRTAFAARTAGRAPHERETRHAGGGPGEQIERRSSRVAGHVPAAASAITRKSSSPTAAAAS